MKASILQFSAFFVVQFSHLYTTNGKAIVLTIQNFVTKVMSLLFNMKSRFVVPFLPRSKLLLVSLLHSQSSEILETKKIKSVTVFTFSPSICYKVMGLNGMIIVYLMMSFKSGFSLSSFTLMKRLFSSSLLTDIRVVSSAYIRLSTSSGNVDFSLCYIQPGISHDVSTQK